MNIENNLNLEYKYEYWQQLWILTINMNIENNLNIDKTMNIDKKYEYCQLFKYWQ